MSLTRCITRAVRVASCRLPATSLSLTSLPTHASFSLPVLSVPVPAVRSFSSSSPTSASAPKTSTNMAGLDVIPNGREVLIGLEKEIIACVDAYNKQLGFEPAFNNFVRRFAAHRLKVAEEEDDIAEIERRLFSGQIEELIEQAENELDLIVMANEEAKPWEKKPEDRAEYDLFATPQFGQDPETFASGLPKPLSKEERELVDAFWKELDEEIKQDQEREAKEREQRRANKKQQ